VRTASHGVSQARADGAPHRGHLLRVDVEEYLQQVGDEGVVVADHEGSSNVPQYLSRWSPARVGILLGLRLFGVFVP
jgi:hypothetical protein